MASTMKARPSIMRTRREEEAQYRLLMAASFMVFLIGALLTRLAPSHWRASRASGDSRERQSVIAEARAAAQTVVPFAFMI